MITELGALVLFSGRLTETVEFYKDLGLPLEDEHHEDGVLHVACELGPVHVAIFEAPDGQAPRFREGGCSFPGFVVTSVCDAVERARERGAPVREEPAEMPWGLRAVIDDPDGRPVEVFERPV